MIPDIKALAWQRYIKAALGAIEDNYREYQCHVQSAGQAFGPEVEPSKRAYGGSVEVLARQVALMEGCSAEDAVTAITGYVRAEFGWPGNPKGLDEWNQGQAS